ESHMVYRSCSKLGVVVFASMLSTAAVANPDSLKPVVNIYVTSSLDGLDRATQLAEEYAGQILAKAGVGVRWVNCRPGGSSQIRGPRDFGFHIRKEMPPDYSGAALGFASIVHPFGVASYSRIEAVAFRRHMAVAPILGAVMAHEIGHWLLGANAHSPHGVM